MKHFKLFGIAIALSGVFSTVNVFADQIEREARETARPSPAGVLVKVNPDTKTVEVYRAEKVVDQNADSTEKLAAVKSIESPSNKIAEFKLSTNELDKDSSTEAWRYRWYYSSWSWNNWSGYSPYYYSWTQSTPYGAGYFNYGYRYRYNYNYSYNYNRCNYDWYY